MIASMGFVDIVLVFVYMSLSACGVIMISLVLLVNTPSVVIDSVEVRHFKYFNDYNCGYPMVTMVTK